jgi:hypothetical protein
MVYACIDLGDLLGLLEARGARRGYPGHRLPSIKGIKGRRLQRPSGRRSRLDVIPDYRAPMRSACAQPPIRKIDFSVQARFR